MKYSFPRKSYGVLKMGPLALTLCEDVKPGTEREKNGMTERRDGWQTRHDRLECV